MIPEKQEFQVRSEEQEQELTFADSGMGGLFETDDQELLEERVSALNRTGQRLKRFIRELKRMESELDRLDLAMRLPGLSARRRHDLQLEIDLSVNAFNHLREAASCSFGQLIRQRESFGFRAHDVLHRCYRIPDMLLPSDAVEEFLEA